MQNAVGAAVFVISVAMAVFAVAAAIDDWPAVVMMAYGAALGAGVAINAVSAQSLDARITNWRHVITLQSLTFVVPMTLAWVLWLEESRLLVVPVMLTPLWAWELLQSVGQLERSDASDDGDLVYPRAFQYVTLAFAFCLLYAAAAVDTPWLWRPTTWDHFQPLIWLLILQFAALPIALRSKRSITPSSPRSQSPP